MGSCSVWWIVFAVVNSALLVANARQDNGSADSTLTGAEVFNEPAATAAAALSATTRKSRAIDSQLAVETSESAPRRDSARAVARGSRSAEDDKEDNETVATTSPPPLENNDSTSDSDASSASPGASRNASTELQAEDSSSRAARDDPELTSENDRADAGADNDASAISASEESRTVAATTTTIASPVLPSDAGNDAEREQADQIPELRTPSEEAQDDARKDEVEASSAKDVATESEAPPSTEDVQGENVSDIEALEHMHPGVPATEDNDEQSLAPSPSPVPSEQTTEEAPASSSSPASEEEAPTSEAREETSVPSSSAASEEAAPASEANAPAEQPPLPESPDVDGHVETTTADSSPEHVSTEKPPEVAESTEKTTESDEDNEANPTASSTTENEDSGAVIDTEDKSDDASNETNSSTTETSTTETTSLATNTSTAQPSKSKYDFVVYDESKAPCILASMAITLRVNYLMTTDMKTQTQSLQVPPTAQVSGNCGETDSNMTLSWPINGVPYHGQGTITFAFKRDDSHFFVSNVQVSLFRDDDDLHSAVEQAVSGSSARDLRLFSARLGSGVHVCRVMTEVHCGEILALINDVSLIAYNVGDSGLLERKEEYCLPASKSVSIAAVVGGVVGLTVTIGIVASYAWYRKSSRGTFRSELP